MRALIIVRTHVASDAALAAFDRYSRESGHDVVFVADEREAPVDPGERDKISMTIDSLTSLGLYPHPQAGWRCGDYSYYTARDARPDYDFYWLIEPDVYLNYSDLKDFFGFWANDTSDFVGIKLAPQTPAWVWYHTVSERYETVYGCVFSISRLSARAVDRLLDKRREASIGATDEIRDEWPNDESFTASTIMAEKLVTCDFNDRDRAFYSGRSFRNGAAFDTGKLTAAEPDGLIYHPVQDLDVWLEDNRKKLGHVKEVKYRHQLSAMNRYAIALMESEETREFALIPLMQARTGWQNPSWRNYRHAADESNKAEKIERMLANAFGVKQERQQVAVVYNTWSSIRPNSTRLASPGEFTFEDGVPVRTFPKSLALPFCWDLDAQELLCTLTLKPQVLLDRPFLYEGQRELARVIARVPLTKLNRIFGEYDADAPLTFLMSIGRTGSTLFHSLLKVAVPRSISEPDTLTQLAAEKDRWKDDPALRKRLLWHSISPFLSMRMRIGDETNGPVIIKTRSQVNGIASELIRTFPKATFVFMTRGRAAWARSTLRSFNMKPKLIAGRLLQGVMALERMKKLLPELTIVSYESIVANPVGAVEAVIGRPTTEAERAEIAERMTQDSQAGTAVARERTEIEAADEERLLAEFEAEWASMRPAKVIERLGLDL